MDDLDASDSIDFFVRVLRPVDSSDFSVHRVWAGHYFFVEIESDLIRARHQDLSIDASLYGGDIRLFGYQIENASLTPDEDRCLAERGNLQLFLPSYPIEESSSIILEVRGTGDRISNADMWEIGLPMRAAERAVGVELSEYVRQQILLDRL